MDARLETLYRMQPLSAAETDTLLPRSLQAA